MSAFYTYEYIVYQKGIMWFDANNYNGNYVLVWRIIVSLLKKSAYFHLNISKKCVIYLWLFNNIYYLNIYQLKRNLCEKKK